MRKVIQTKRQEWWRWFDIYHLQRILIVGILAVGGSGLHASSPPAVCAPEADAPTSKGRTQVMMVLSPRMPYALKEWRRMSRIAEEAGYKVVTVRDPRVPLDEWEAAVRVVAEPELMHAPVIEQAQAESMGALNHSPASLVSRCAQTHPWPVLGVMPDGPWLAVLRARESQLARTICC